MSPQESSTHLVDVEIGVAPVPSPARRRFSNPSSARSSSALQETKKGVHLRWTSICKTVEVKEFSTGLIRSSIAAPTMDKQTEQPKTGGVVMKTILDGVSGSAAPGEILALMGPSGSGKTSLLDVLSGRSKYDSGMITIDGAAVTGSVMKRLKRKIAYVKQRDVFFDHLTVRDQLTYTALLRLPSSWPKAKKFDEVKRILKQLRLQKCADTPLFMVSGGEKKRVNIGTELLTDPSIVILDEPTSGLDSSSAVALVHLLHNLAQKDGKTIITSIHQPSSGVFRGFDKLMLLADGHMVYYGTPVDSLSYLKNMQYECPSGYNAADHWMDLLVIDSAIEQEENEEDASTQIRHLNGSGAESKNSPRIKLIEAWNSEEFATKVESEMKIQPILDGSDSQDPEDTTAVEQKYNSSWWTQFSVLVHRSMKNSRSSIFTTLNVIKSCVIGLVVGLLWFQLPYTESAVFDRSSYYFFTMTYWVFDAMFTAFMAFPNERTIIMKERSSGSYHLSAYFMAKTISEAPTRLILPAIYMTISYWMGMLNPRFVTFLGSCLVTLLCVLAGESIGLLVGATLFDFEKGLVVMTVVSLALMVAGGFFVQNVPPFISWIKFLSPFKYAYDGSVQIVFDVPVPCDGSGVLPACSGGDAGYASVESVRQYLGVQGTVGFNVGLLVVVFLLPRIGAYFALRGKKSVERM